ALACARIWRYWAAASWFSSASDTRLDIVWVRFTPTSPDWVVCTWAQAASSTAMPIAHRFRTSRIMVVSSWLASGALPPVAQGVVHQHDGQQGFGDGRGADRHARIVASERLHHDRLVGPVHGTALDTDAGSGLDGQGHPQRLSGGNPAQHAARVIAHETVGAEFVAVFRAAHGNAIEARADRYALDGIQPHHGMGDVRVQPVIDG